MQKTIIRASSLPHYPDCTRRSAAKMYFNELMALGFNLNSTKTSIGAVVGTATHAALETALILKSKGKSYKDEIEQTAFNSIEFSIEKGVIWDDTTMNKDTALIQAIRQAKVVVDVMPAMSEITVEDEFKAKISDDFILSGHIDIRGKDNENHAIFDLKTGTVRRANQAQYGAYSLLCRSNGIDVKRIGEIYVKRVGVRKPQPDPVLVEFKVKEAEQIAFNTIKRIKADLINFRQTNDIWSFLPNPNSMMCLPDYCPAYDTNFCNCHKDKI